MTTSGATDPLAWLMRLEGVASAYAATRDGIDALLRDRGLRRTTPEMTGESLLRGAFATAALEGSESEWEAVRDGSGDAIAQDAVRLATELLAMVPILQSSPLQALARLHAVAAKGALPAEQLGRPRDPGAADRLRRMSGMLVAQSSTPGLVVAAMVHAEIASTGPFASHNGVVARAAERLVLVARGVDPRSVLVPEAGHLALRPQYESNLRGYAERGQRGVHAWLLYAAEAYSAGAEASPLASGGC